MKYTMQALVVTNAFADYARGDFITDKALIADILDSSNSANVVMTALPDPVKSTTAPAAA